jgi:hypothetical protein
LRTGRKGLAWDALLGALAFVGGLLASDWIPTASNTVTRRVGKMIIHSTARHYQHPYFAALLAALLLVALHEAFRAVRAARASQ